MATSNRFDYSTEIDKTIARAAQEALGFSVTASGRIDRGVINHIYKLDTEKGLFVARVFRNQNWPENGKLEWIEGQLSSYGIAHPKIAYFSRDDKYFPFGFMIEDFVIGKSGWDAIKDGDISLEDFFKQIGETLKRVHQIKCQKFGLVSNGMGLYLTLSEFFQKEIDKEKDDLRKIPDFNTNLFPLVEKKILKPVEQLENRIAPVLTHDDAGPDNCIFTPDRQIVLIDWDNARADCWIRDLAKLTYGSRHMDKFAGGREEVVKRLRPAFLSGYGQNEFSDEEIKILEKAYHTFSAFRLLAFNYFRQNNKEKYLKHKERLLHLLNI